MSNYHHCIVTLIDMIGIRGLLKRGDSAAVSKMRRMHSTIANTAERFVDGTEICFWNDSVLIHSLVEESEVSFVSAMRPIVALKAAIDAICPSYAISVKGKSFPPQKIQVRPGNACQMIYLSASSLAFTNCFDIEASLKTDTLFKKRRYQWYVDNRIIKQIKGTLSKLPDWKHKFDLYPRGARRTFHMFDVLSIRDDLGIATATEKSGRKHRGNRS